MQLHYSSAAAAAEIQNSLKADIQYEIDDIPERETRGSGYVFDRVITHEIQLAKYEPLKGPQGSHYLKLPDNLKALFRCARARTPPPLSPQKLISDFPTRDPSSEPR